MARQRAQSWWPITRIVILIPLLLLLRQDIPLLKNISKPLSWYTSHGNYVSASRKGLENGMSNLTSLVLVENTTVVQHTDGGSDSLRAQSELREIPGKRLGLGFKVDLKQGRRLLEDSQNTTHRDGDPPNDVNSAADAPDTDGACTHVQDHPGYASECAYIQAHASCQSGEMIDYLHMYYCTFGKFRIAGAVVLGVLLASLFFTLGNTAADYFCPSLEELSELLRLPPTVAGVTLLPLGNGAPDVFASIAAFVGAGEGQVGLNSVLGAGFFVTAVVAGSVNLVVSSMATSIHMDQGSFVRDVCFYLLSLSGLLTIMLAGSIHLTWALGFLSIYLIYGLTVAVSEFMRARPQGRDILLQPIRGVGVGTTRDENDAMWLYDPLLDSDEAASSPHQAALPQWMWTSNVAIYSGKGMRGSPENPRPLWGWSEEEEPAMPPCCSCETFCEYFVKLPLMLPRRLTIPSRQQEGWSKGYAVGSAALAPFLCAFVFSGGGASWRPYVWAACAGAVFGTAAFVSTDSSGPPKRFALPWVLGGFVMSVVWFYIIANELVAVLVAVGIILRIDSALLGLTVLAWGNSIGDAVANLAMACNGNPDGVQIAWSGCYAGPMFNTLVGLGSSLVLASWKTYPHNFTIPRDPTLPYTMMFLVSGLLYSLVVMPLNGMKFSKVQGVGLIFLYLCFMALRILHVLGLAPMPGVL